MDSGNWFGRRRRLLLLLVLLLKEAPQLGSVWARKNCNPFQPAPFEDKPESGPIRHELRVRALASLTVATHA